MIAVERALRRERADVQLVDDVARRAAVPRHPPSVQAKRRVDDRDGPCDALGLAARGRDRAVGRRRRGGSGSGGRGSHRRASRGEVAVAARLQRLDPVGGRAAARTRRRPRAPTPRSAQPPSGRGCAPSVGANRSRGSPRARAAGTRAAAASAPSSRAGRGRARRRPRSRPGCPAPLPPYTLGVAVQELAPDARRGARRRGSSWRGTGVKLKTDEHRSRPPRAEAQNASTLARRRWRRPTRSRPGRSRARAARARRGRGGSGRRPSARMPAWPGLVEQVPVEARLVVPLVATAPNSPPMKSSFLPGCAYW